MLVSSTKSPPDLFGSFGFWFAHVSLGTNLRLPFFPVQGIFLRWLRSSVPYTGALR